MSCRYVLISSFATCVFFSAAASVREDAAKDIVPITDTARVTHTPLISNLFGMAGAGALCATVMTALATTRSTSRPKARITAP